MKKSASKKIFIIQLLSLTVIAVVAYFVAVENGLRFRSGVADLFEFKIWVFLIILGAFISTSLVMIYTYRVSKSRDEIQDQLYIEQELTKLHNNKLADLNDSLQNMNQAIMIIGNDDFIAWVNNGFEKMFGYTKFESIGKKASELLAGPLTDEKAIKEMDQAVFVDYEPFNAELVQYRKDKSILWARVYITPFTNDQGNLKKYIAVCEDISEEIAAKELLAKSEANFRQITSTINDMVYLYDVENKKYEFVSHNAEKIMGVSSDLFYAGKSWDHTKWHPEDEQIVKDANKTVDSGSPYRIQYRLEVNGIWKWIEERSFPIFNDKGVVVRNSGVCSDITEVKLYEQELKLKNSEILQSINYAKGIQQATLTNANEISKLFEDYTLFYSPKDIVSGDFYNVSSIKMNDGTELKSIVVADCTGHGVPGAVLAITCNNIVQSTLSNKDINSPAEALTFTRDALVKLFDQSEEKIYDGMDVSWCVWNPSSSEIYFSGAYNSLYIIRNKEIITVPADRMHVAYGDELKDFTNQVVPVQKGDLVFLTSDGFADQFGGSRYKKFGRKRFFDLLNTFTDEPLKNQNIFEETHIDWKEDFEQTDDVCVFGFRIT